MQLYADSKEGATVFFCNTAAAAAIAGGLRSLSTSSSYRESAC